MKLFLGILAAAWKCLRLELSDDVHGDSDCEDGELLLSSFPMFGGQRANPLSGLGNCSLHSTGRGSLFPSLHSADTHPQAGIFLMPYQFQQAEIKLNCLKASVCLTFRNPQRNECNSPHLFQFFLNPGTLKKVGGGPKHEAIRVVDQTFLSFLLIDESESFPSALKAKQVILPPKKIHVLLEISII